MRISITINGEKRRIETTPTARLLDLIRDQLDLTGTKEGCGKGECGACTVIMNGELVASCLMLALQADGADIITIEGLGSEDKLDPIQRAYIEVGAVQCGYCTPGMILASKKLLEENPQPDQGEIRRGLSGNICRCTGYQKIIAAVQLSAEKMAAQGDGQDD